jgi:Flp pilus assembly protein TadD
MVSPDSQQFFNAGVTAYKSGQYSEAIELLRTAVDNDSSDWMAKLYLAMCLAKNNQTREALKLFMTIRDLCPDRELRQRAGSAYFAISSMPLQHNA